MEDTYPEMGNTCSKNLDTCLIFGDGLFLRVPKRRRHANRAKMLEKSGITVFLRVPKRPNRANMFEKSEITFFLRVPKRRSHANRAKMLEISKLGF